MAMGATAQYALLLFSPHVPIPAPKTTEKREPFGKENLTLSAAFDGRFPVRLAATTMLLFFFLQHLCDGVICLPDRIAPLQISIPKCARLGWKGRKRLDFSAA